MKRYALLGLILLSAACEMEHGLVNPTFSETGTIRITLGNEKTKSSPDSLNVNAKPAKPARINQLEVRVLKSDNTPVTSETFTPSDGYFEGTITVKAQNDLKVLCIGTNNGIVERFGIDEDVDVEPGKETDAVITGWNSRFIPEITSISPNPSTDGSYTIIWNTAPNATSYVLQEADNQQFSGAVASYSTTSLQINISGKAAGTCYYRVQASSEYNIKSGWSLIESAVVQNTHTISGTVSGADGVTVTLSGDASETQTVNDGETYLFTVAEDGSYTVTPSKKGYSFTPTDQTFNNVTSSHTRDFTGAQDWYTISGKVTGADGVTVILGGDASDSKTVDDGGTYSFTVGGGGSYTVIPFKTDYLFNPASSSFTEITSNHTQDFTGISSVTYTLSGTVSGADGVTITLIGDASGSLVVNDGGSYSFTVAEGGNYFITPSKSGFFFIPAVKNFDNVTADQTQNFVANVITYTLSGTVSGADGVTITLSGDATDSLVVDDGGSYSFNVAEGGNYIVIPSKSGFFFTPAIKTFNNVTDNQTQNFDANVITHTISGTISGADGVTITLSGDVSGSLVVNDGGSYSFTVAEGGNFIVTPSKSGFFFIPSVKNFDNVTADQTQNFDAHVITYTLSGTVFGADGVTVTLSGDATDSLVVNDGVSYSFTVAEGGNYTVTPSKSGYTFTPAVAAYNNVTSNQTQNFVANIITYTISGTISGADSVTVNLSGDKEQSLLVDDGGTYSFTVDFGGDYIVTPTKSDYTFTPASRTFNNVTSNQTQDFSAVQKSKIAFMSDRDGNSEIYVMYVDGSKPRNLTNNPVGNDRWPSWSPDGSQIAFHRHDENHEIYVMDADGSNQTRLTYNSFYDGNLSWSPDGSQMVFGSTRDGSDQEIYVMDADGSNPTRLTYNSADDYDSSWSPDGSQIAFASIRDGNWEIYIMDADGSNQTRLTDNPDQDRWPQWSPDGSQIAFYSSRVVNNGIYVMDADGSNQTMLTDNAANYCSSPSWSPDGSKIAFVSGRDGNDEIYVMDADGSNQIRLTYNSVTDQFPSWSPF